jgi:hypothetical protein
MRQSLRSQWIAGVVVAVVFVGFAGLAKLAGAQQTELELLPVQGNVYMLSGAGGNIAVQIGSQGTLGSKMQLSFNGEPVEVLHQPAAHTDGDSFVFFRRSDVIAAGDIFLTTTYPFIDLERGGSIQGEIDALNTLVETMVPLHEEEGGM